MASAAQAHPASGVPTREVVERVLSAVAEALDGTTGPAPLMALLAEDAAIYRQRTAFEVTRLRAYVMQAFGQLGLPDGALPAVLEELESGHEAYSIAAAARALRGLPHPDEALGMFVDAAEENLRGRDEYVSFEPPHILEAAPAGRTALDELAETRRFLASRASQGRPAPARTSGDCACFEDLGFRDLRAGGPLLTEVQQLALEDHQGTTRSFAEIFLGKPAIVAFFYTRCENPRKCSLTLTKLSQVQRLLRERGLAGRVTVAAITYDPSFDTPSRLRTYAGARGFQLDGGDLLLRSVGDPRDAHPLRKHFSLGVGYVNDVVNRHRVELYLLGADGRVHGAFVHLQWRPERVVERARGLLPDGRAGWSSARSILVGGSGSLPAVMLLLLPKCPLCWAAYASTFSMVGLEWFLLSPWLKPLLCGLAVVNLLAAWIRGRMMQRYLPLGLSLLGTILVVCVGVMGGVRSGLVLGVLTTALGALLGALPPSAIAARSGRLADLLATQRPFPDPASRRAPNYAWWRR